MFKNINMCVCGVCHNSILCSFRSNISFLIKQQQQKQKRNFIRLEEALAAATTKTTKKKR
jgi:hypothetical protein